MTNQYEIHTQGVIVKCKTCIHYDYLKHSLLCYIFYIKKTNKQTSINIFTFVRLAYTHFSPVCSHICSKTETKTISKRVGEKVHMYNIYYIITYIFTSYTKGPSQFEPRKKVPFMVFRSTLICFAANPKSFFFFE